ncbi:MAG TPA: tetratricopeptide repeat protein [Candidatus Dormibacteraeota bacterium]|nr:tetratricopeptide repeat protein [Candidatus Dormibacteraeota bacterium]
MIGTLLAASSLVRGQTAPSQSGTIVVSVRTATGETIDSLPTINVYTRTRQLFVTATAGAASLKIDAVPVGMYTVEASAPGYITQAENVEVALRNAEVLLTFALRPLGDPTSKPVANKPPLLTPKAQGELSKGLKDLRANHAAEAQKHLLNAQKLAPNNPDVNYLLGVIASQSNDVARAAEYWEKAVSAFPTHVFSLLALGEVRLSQGNLPKAKTYIEQAVAADATSWRAHEALARVMLQGEQFADAQKEGEKALALGKLQANGARLVLAKALIGMGNKDEEAKKVLKAFLEGKPSAPEAATAERILDALAELDKESILVPTVLSGPATAMPRVEAAGSAPLPLPPPLKWTPPDVDASVPPVESSAVCRMEEFLPKVQKNVVKFTHTLDSFTATEKLENQVVNNEGVPQRQEKLTFNYLVLMEEIRPGVLNVDEYRNRTMALDVFPDGIATKGLPSIILIFHPAQTDDYEMVCEGLGSWRGIPAWQVHFQQRADRPGRSLTYRVNGIVHPVALKGRAWISRDSLQVVRIETDLMQAIPEIRLFGEHQEIDYGPVPFAKEHTEFWLPATTDFYTDFRGKKIHRRLSYSDYVLFTVEERQQIGEPSVTKEKQQARPN